MYRNPFADASRLADSGAQFGFGVLIRRGKNSVVDRIRAGFINFRKTRSLFALLAHYFNQLFSVIGKVGIWKDVLRRVKTDGVFMAAENVDGIAADPQSRPRNFPLINGIS